MPEQFKLFFVQRFKGSVRFDVQMSEHTTLGIGGRADVMAFPKDEADLVDLITFASGRKFPLFVLGRGANLLVRDGGIRGIVVNMNEGLGDIVWKDECKVSVGAGVRLAGFSKKSAKRGLSGAEFLADIPGTVGGAITMNAGAHGREMKDIVDGVEALDKKGKKIFLSNSDMEFSYRSAKLPDGAIVVRVHVTLEEKDPAVIEKKINELREKRKANTPVRHPSAGSVFKNPVEGSAGKFIEDAGLKGHRQGDAQFSTAHANYIVNLGRATARDVLSLMALARDTVYSKTGVLLEPEIKVVGEG